MIIKHAQKSEISEILAVYDKAKSFMRQNGNHLQWINGYPSYNDVLEDINNNNLYVMKVNSLIVGVFAFIIGEDPSYSYIEGNWLNNEKYGTIHRIASNFEVKGILEKAVEFCFSKINNLRIDTHEVNYPMQNAILKNGFTKCGIIYLVSDNTPRIAYQKVC